MHKLIWLCYLTLQLVVGDASLAAVCESSESLQKRLDAIRCIGRSRMGDTYVRIIPILIWYLQE